MTFLIISVLRSKNDPTQMLPININLLFEMLAAFEICDSSFDIGFFGKLWNFRSAL